MYQNVKQSVKSILAALDGIPEECSWLDYKAACEFDPVFKEKIKYLVIAFMNSLFELGKDKYIIFGIREDKKTKQKTLTGLGEHKFPDDNEWQNLFDSIKPHHAHVDTGSLKYKGLLFGYILIHAENYYVPYHCKKSGSDVYYIRRGGNKYDDMTEFEKDELMKKRDELIQGRKVYPKSEILNVLTALGQCNESNQDDIHLIESSTGRKYSDITTYCMNMDRSFRQNEKSIYGTGRTETVHILEKHNRLLQFTTDEVIHVLNIIQNILKDENTGYSPELLDGITDTLIFLTNNGFSYYTKQVIESIITVDFFQNYKYSAIFPQLTEVFPGCILNLISQNKEQYLGQKPEIKAAIIESLRVIAWFPEFYTEAVKLLIEFGDKAVYELFECGVGATSASFFQKWSLMEELAENDKEHVFEMLNTILNYHPNVAKLLSHSYIPADYRRLRERPYTLPFDQMQAYYDMLVKIADNDADKLLKLLPEWLMPFPFSNLHLLASHIARVEPSIKSIDGRQKLWNRLCNSPLVYITDSPVDDILKNRFIAIGERFKPDDIYRQYQQWFRDNIVFTLSLDNTEFEAARAKVFEEQKNILLTLYRQNGINGMANFIRTVTIDSYDLMQMLMSEEFSLTIEDDNVLILEFLSYPQTYSSYFSSKSYHNKIDWIKKLNIKMLEPQSIADFFAVLNASMENIAYFEEVLEENILLYWTVFKPQKADGAPVIEYVFMKLIGYGMPQKAYAFFEFLPVSILKQLSPRWLYDTLTGVEKYSECSIPIDAFENSYCYLYSIFDNALIENLEELSFRMYGKISYYCGYAGLKPRITFQKLANDAEFFVEMVSGAMIDLRGLSEHLLRYCDVRPQNPCEWLSHVNNLIAKESESLKEKADYWMGYMFYNAVFEEAGAYQIDNSIAALLEPSEKRIQGFWDHAYYPNGFHGNGRYEEDSEDREKAEKFRNMAKVQNENGNTALGKSLYTLADCLIAGVELEI